MSIDSTAPREDVPNDLYRYFDADGHLLYVGISFNAVQRAIQHRQGKSWWSDVVNMTVERLPSRRAAIEAERVAIATEKPIHNIMHNTPIAVATTDPGVGPVDFDMSGPKCVIELYCELASNMQYVAGMFDHWQVQGLPNPSRREFLATVDAMARSLIYGDDCDECGTVCHPVYLKHTSPTWAICGYYCVKCQRRWTCGWSTDMTTVTF